MKTIILFDLDGTLIDSTDAILHSFKSAFFFNNLNYNEENIKSLIGYTLDDIFLKSGVNHKDIQKYIDIYRQEYRKIFLEQTTLLPRTLQALKLAKTFAILGIVTTKNSKSSKILLKHLGIYDFFKVIIGREDVNFPKPHAEPILKALSMINTNANEIFMIGDTKLDVLAAKNANIKAIALSCGYESEESLKKYSDTIKKDVYEAVKFIYNLNYNIC